LTRQNQSASWRTRSLLFRWLGRRRWLGRGWRWEADVLWVAFKTFVIDAGYKTVYREDERSITAFCCSACVIDKRLECIHQIVIRRIGIRSDRVMSINMHPSSKRVSSCHPPLLPISGHRRLLSFSYSLVFLHNKCITTTDIINNNPTTAVLPWVEVDGWAASETLLLLLSTTGWPLAHINPDTHTSTDTPITTQTSCTTEWPLVLINKVMLTPSTTRTITITITIN